RTRDGRTCLRKEQLRPRPPPLVGWAVVATLQPKEQRQGETKMETTEWLVRRNRTGRAHKWLTKENDTACRMFGARSMRAARYEITTCTHGAPMCTMCLAATVKREREQQNAERPGARSRDGVTLALRRTGGAS